MYIPDIRVGSPVPQGVSEKTGKPLKPVQYALHACRSCGERSVCPMKQDGGMSKNLGKCPFCSGKR